MHCELVSCTDHTVLAVFEFGKYHVLMRPAKLLREQPGSVTLLFYD